MQMYTYAKYHKTIPCTGVKNKKMERCEHWLQYDMLKKQNP